MHTLCLRESCVHSTVCACVMCVCVCVDCTYTHTYTNMECEGAPVESISFTVQQLHTAIKVHLIMQYHPSSISGGFFRLYSLSSRAVDASGCNLGSMRRHWRTSTWPPDSVPPLLSCSTTVLSATKCLAREQRWDWGWGGVQ